MPANDEVALAWVISSTELNEVVATPPVFVVLMRTIGVAVVEVAMVKEYGEASRMVEVAATR